MNNEPVAWMDYLEHSDVYDLNVSGRGIPLYTHPAKTLTDDEIDKVRITIMNTAYWCADENMSEAYNAVKVCCSEVLEILRKAQEK